MVKGGAKPCPLTQKIDYRVVQALTSGLLRAKLISIALCQIINICQETKSRLSSFGCLLLFYLRGVWDSKIRATVDRKQKDLL